MAKPKKQRTRQADRYPVSVAHQPDWGLPRFLPSTNGATQLLLGVFDILTLGPHQIRQISLGSGDALAYDTQAIMTDAAHAHHQLLQRFPQLVR